MGGWFDRTRAKAKAEGEPRVSYAAADRIRVHSDPDSASAVRGVLTLHEKLRRYQSEDGFAYVEAEGGIWGWVPESQLVERIPRRVEPAPAEAAPEPEGSAETEGEGAEEGESPAPESEPTQPERSVFDPY